MNRKQRMDLTNGSVFHQLIVFAFPILMTNILQQLYHSADMIVVGNFARDPESSLAAVGATSQITALLINFFVATAVGTNALCAQARGAGDRDRELRVIGTSLILSVTAGIALAFFGWIFTPSLLRLIDTPKEILAEATLYMRIIFLGQPASLLFNFSSASLRAGGNAKLPMRIMMVTGFINVCLNLVFVLGLHLDSAGVAIATVVAHYLSALSALTVLFHPAWEYRLTLKKLRFFKKEAGGMLKIGVPAGLNAILFNFSSVIVTTAANAMGKTVVASVAAANSITNLVHTMGNSFNTALVSFSGQNYGAGKLRRTEESFRKAIILVESVFLVTNIALTLFPAFFMGIYNDDPDVIRMGIPKLLLTSWGYMVYLFAEFANSTKRGFGKSIMPTVLNIVCVCGVRILWVLGIFPHLPQTVLSLYICIPLSWICTSTANMIDFAFVKKRVWKKSYEEGRLCPEDAAYYEAKLKK